jgi:hypothetical protein
VFTQSALVANLSGRHPIASGSRTDEIRLYSPYFSLVDSVATNSRL